MTIRLTLPYSVGSKRYWRAVIIKGHAVMVPTKAVKAYKGKGAWLAQGAGANRMPAEPA